VSVCETETEKGGRRASSGEGVLSFVFFFLVSLQALHAYSIENTASPPPPPLPLSLSSPSRSCPSRAKRDLSHSPNALPISLSPPVLRISLLPRPAEAGADIHQ